jgi:hypothetical protein
MGAKQFLFNSLGNGCHIGLVCVGALAYSDNLVLLAACANAISSMLRVCDLYAAYVVYVVF